MTLANSVTPSAVFPFCMTEEKYLLWNTPEISAEWVAGEVKFKMPITDVHDLLQAAIRSSLQALVSRRNLGQVRGEKFAMRLAQRPSYREADVIFIARENEARLSRLLLTGPADIALEIVSPGSVSLDYREKYAEYEAAGIREYWIIDPLINAIETHYLNNAGKYVPLAPNADGKFNSTVVPGWWLSAAFLFKEPVPDALDLMQLLGVV